MDVAKLLEHSDDWHAQRRQGIGGSDAPKIMKGEWGELWDQKTGASEGDDLSDILAVQMGSFTEPLNVYWFTRQTGKQVTLDNCDHLTHPQHKFMRANLDGRIVTENAIFEAKHVGAFFSGGDIVDRYFPQLQHCMAVARVKKAYLSVFFGNAKWEMFEILANQDYQDELIARETEFWGHVERDERPGGEQKVIPVVPWDKRLEVDMAGSNAWAVAAAEWLENKAAAKAFETAKVDLKDLIEPNVKLAHGHGVEISVSKGNAKRIKERK